MEKFSLTSCSGCSEPIDKHRAHLGYTECLDCSEVEAYSAHTVYPHKTGGYVQPINKSTSKHLKSLDRRSTGNTRKAKSVGGNWDKWLEQYYHNMYNPEPEREPVQDISTIQLMDSDTLYNKAILYYKDNGYQPTIDWLKQLFSEDKISLNNKSKMLDEINRLEVLPTKIRKMVINEKRHN